MKLNLIRNSFGIDISKDSFAVQHGWLDEGLNIQYGKRRSFNNNRSGIADFKLWAEKQGLNSACYIIEATGVYYENLAYSLSDSQMKTSVLLPNKARAFAQSLDIKSKTDELDAMALCRMGLERQLPEWKAPDKTLREIKLLTRERSQYQKKKTMASNQLHAYKSAYSVPKAIIARLEKEIEFLISMIAEIEQALEELTFKHKELSECVPRIMGIPGVGLISAITVIAETNQFALVRNIKQLVSYAGLDVQLKQSGRSSKKARISKKGNAHIRKALYMPALTASRNSSFLNQFYQRVNQGKPAKKIGVVAVERKLLALIYTLWKSGEEFDPRRHMSDSGNDEMQAPLSGYAEHQKMDGLVPAHH